MEQKNGSKSVKEYIKPVYCHPAYLIYMQSTSCGMLGWMKHKLESRFLGEISITSDNTTLMAESKEELKNLILFPLVAAPASISTDSVEGTLFSPQPL